MPANLAVEQIVGTEKYPHPSPISMPMQAIRFGNTVTVTFPGEVFTEIGVSVKKKSPYENTFIPGVKTSLKLIDRAAAF